MKKIMSLMLGLSLIVGSAVLAFGQDPAPAPPKGGGKKGGKKGDGKPKGGDDKAHRSTSSN